MKKKIVIIALLIFILSACGRGSNDGEGGNDNAGGHTAGVVGSTAACPDHDGPTLTIFVGQMWQEQRFAQTADALIARFAEEGINLHVELLSYLSHEERDDYFALMLSKFAAGMGSDIVVRDGFPIYQFVENGFIADIFPMIDNSPNLSRDDFFVNALNGFTIDGRLYTFPLQFGMDYVGINANVPQEFINRFADMTMASTSDLVNLYMDLIEAHPEWGEFAIADNVQLVRIINEEAQHAIDFAGRTANLSSPDALMRLENARTAFENIPLFETPWVMDVDEEHMALLQSHYVFHLPVNNSDIEALFEYRQPFFINYVPHSDESGRVIHRAWGVELLVSQTADHDLAWAFIEQFITDTFSDGFGGGSGNIPIARRYFRESLEQGFQSQLQFTETRPLATSQYNAIQTAVDRLTRYAELPFVRLIQGFVTPWYMLAFHADYATEFAMGNISAEEFAARSDAEITEWLNTERTIEPYIAAIPPDPQDDPDYGLPIRAITIQASNEHTAVIEQAAAAMNASWRARNYPYAFRVEVDEYDHRDWEGREGRHTRLSTQLMAGQGPDIFFYDGQNIHAMARQGFLANIYDLIDQNPNTNRDDFFPNVFSAIEISGGLYQFPISFGFEFIGINGSLPQDILNRVAGQQKINPSQMQALYTDLKTNHGDEFGHLIHGTWNSAINFNAMFFRLLEDFIDFDMRTSTINDPRFAAYMADVHQFSESLAPWREGLTVGMMVPISTPENHRDRAADFMFREEASWLNPAFALLPFDNPHFLHYAVLVDDHGHVIVHAATRGSRQATLCITNAGNSALAWEFAQYLIHAYTFPVGRAATSPMSMTAERGTYSMAVPILRSLFNEHFQATLEHVYERSTWGWSCLNAHSEAQRDAYIQTAINRLHNYANMPMRSSSPRLPMDTIENLLMEPLMQFIQGLITPEAAAQRMHNSIALWLIE